MINVLTFSCFRYLTGYRRPTLDESQDTYNIKGTSSNGLVTIEFVRKRSTFDKTNDLHFSDDECLYLIYPVRGASYNAVNKQIHKHEITPKLSEEPVCIGDVLPVASPEPSAEPEPKPEPDAKAKPEPSPTSTTTQATESSVSNQPLFYKVSMKLTDISWSSNLAVKNSREYAELEQEMATNVRFHFNIAL